MEVGDKLNPQRSYRKGFALKGLRQHIIKTNNPSTGADLDCCIYNTCNSLLLKKIHIYVNHIFSRLH